MTNTLINEKVWSAFERVLEDGRTVKFEIKNVSEDMRNTVVEFMLGNYIREDVWWVTAGTSKDVDAIQEYRVLLTSIVKQNMSIMCFLTERDGTGRTLVAVNLCLPQKKGQFVEHVPPKTQAGLLSLRMFAEAMKITTIYSKYKVEDYLMGAGLSVTPEYRGLGIGVELLRARFNVAKEFGYRVTAGIFTGIAAQRCAEKAEMECFYQINYNDFGKKCDVKFDTTTEYLKMYAAKIN